MDGPAGVVGTGPAEAGPPRPAPTRQTDAPARPRSPFPPRPAGRPVSSRRGGFALVFALVLLAALSAAAIAVLTRARGDDDDARRVLAAARARHAAEGAAARALATLATHRAAERPLPPTGTTWLWTVAGLPVTVALEPESGKLDLNAGPIALLPLALDGAGLPPHLHEEVVAAVERLRAEGGIAAGPATLLPPCARLGDAEALLARRLTVATRARGLAASALSDDRLAGMPGSAAADIDRLRALAAAGRSPFDDRGLAHLAPLLADAAPLATLRVRVAIPGTAGAELELAALVQHEIGRSTARVISMDTRRVVEGSACAR